MHSNVRRLFRTVIRRQHSKRQYAWTVAHAFARGYVHAPHDYCARRRGGVPLRRRLSRQPLVAGFLPRSLGQTVNAIDGSASPNLSVRSARTARHERWQRPFPDRRRRAGHIPNCDPRRLGRRARDPRHRSHDRTMRMSLIPTSFDLDAFDEMFRASNSRLQRWTSRPSLVVLATVMTYRNSAKDTYEATGEQLSRRGGVADRCAHHGRARAADGQYLHELRRRRCRTARRWDAGQRGAQQSHCRRALQRHRDLARTIGYGQWAEMPDGTVTAGAMYLDRDFDRNDSRRRLLRIHELGHALGYLHVTSRTSMMNPAIGPELNDFDRAGAMIAFQRPVGNRAPDVDPGSGTGGTFGVAKAARRRAGQRRRCADKTRLLTSFAAPSSGPLTRRAGRAAGRRAPRHPRSTDDTAT